MGGGHAGTADTAGAAAADEEVEVVGHFVGSFRKARKSLLFVNKKKQKKLYPI